MIGRPVQDVLGLEFENGDDHIGTALEWGVRVLDKPVVVHAEGDRPEPAKADIFPAYDDDGGPPARADSAMTNRTRNLSILGIVLRAAGGASAVVIAHEDHEARAST